MRSENEEAVTEIRIIAPPHLPLREDSKQAGPPFHAYGFLPTATTWLEVLSATRARAPPPLSARQYVVAAEAIVALKPASLPHGVAGALPLVALTSYQAMVTAGAPWWSSGGGGAATTNASGGGNVSVLLTSGDGGTGVVGVQLAKKLGARTVLTCAAPEHVEYVEGLGADRVVDFTRASVFDGVPDGSIDVVYDNYVRGVAE